MYTTNFEQFQFYKMKHCSDNKSW